MSIREVGLRFNTPASNQATKKCSWQCGLKYCSDLHNSLSRRDSGGWVRWVQGNHHRKECNCPRWKWRSGNWSFVHTQYHTPNGFWGTFDLCFLFVKGSAPSKYRNTRTPLIKTAQQLGQTLEGEDVATMQSQWRNVILLGVVPVPVISSWRGPIDPLIPFIYDWAKNK